MTKVMVTVDTEEDDWGSYAPTGQTTANIGHLGELHGSFARFGVRPTYFVNRPPLVSDEAAVIRDLASDPNAEIGTHCHPWNTPPLGDAPGPGSTMMCSYSRTANRAKIAEVTRLIEDRIGVRPTSFRAGRWGFGPTVAGALVDLGFRVDSSVSPFVDWSRFGGPDYTSAPFMPYRFHPENPLEECEDGPLVEVPTTLGALRGDPVRRARLRARLEARWWARLGVIGVLDRLGIVTRRWLSPELSTEEEMIALAENLVSHGVGVMGMTFHSPTLLVGATPFVATSGARDAFLDRVTSFLSHCVENGWTFATVSEVGEAS